ncbi:hypothetical protein BVX93_01725 [bacterium B13(2017)]|nr:hypothetical protein BVX93_01725 [bacterium B13(2017)]
MTKVAFITTRIDRPSTRYRITQIIPFLQKEGIKCEVFVYPKDIISKLIFSLKFKKFDYVILQRKLISKLEFFLLKKNTKNLIFEFDDSLIYEDSNKDAIISEKKKRRFDYIISHSDQIIAGNKYLKKLATQNTKTIIIPTTVDINKYTTKKTISSSDKIVLGWIGSSSTLIYLKNISNLLDILYEKHPNISLKIVCNNFFDTNKIPLIKKEWKISDEINDLHSFDIGLMPLTDDLWTKGKCGFKLIQYMACGISSVCSPVGVNKEIIIDGVNGFHAQTKEEWIQKLSRLIDDNNLRLTLGQNARKTIEEKYSTQSVIKKYINIVFQ